MPPRSHRILCLALAVVLGLGPTSALALLNIGGSRNQVFVFGNVRVGYDSNIFSSATAEDDTVITGSFGAELRRKRGIIGVNSTVTLQYMKFSRFTDEGGFNPDFMLELTKSTGRTTGELKLHAFRSNRADSAVNLRTTSWNIPLDLSVRYPINEKLYVASATSYLRRDYVEDAQLVDYVDYSQGFDVFYVYNSRIDLLAGYRFRHSDTLVGQSRDHSFTLGVTGGIFPKVTGTVRLGYQLRRTLQTGREDDQITISTSLNWVPTRKLSVEMGVSRDFTITALGDSVDTLGASAHATYSMNRRLEFDAGVSYGRNRFLGTTPRTDDFLEWSASARYTLNEHLTVAGTYSHLENWSTASFSDFTRTGYSLDISSRF
ncbi:MAG TPA: outer membrane beta-barrel protein [Opitutaceae bacterium]|nr:outer membrane beta-barrel protein [Opitutaceae bacterium]